MFKDIKKKIAFIFSISTAIIIVSASLLTSLIISSLIDYQAKTALEQKVSDLTTEYNSGNFKDKNISYQKSNTVNINADRSSESINSLGSDYSSSVSTTTSGTSVTDLTLDKLEALQSDNSAFTQLIASNGTILYTSDLFENSNIPIGNTGFAKTSQNDICVYTYSARINSGEYSGATIRVGQFCPITPIHEKYIYLGIFGIAVALSLLSFIISVCVANLLLKPMEQSVEITKRYIENTHHELLTPLTVALSSVDRAIMTNSYKEGILSVKEDLNEMAATLDFIKNTSFSSAQQINMSKVISQSWKEIVKFHKRDDIKFSMNANSKTKIFANQTVFIVLIKNSLTNICKYTPKDGLVDVKISENEIVFANEILPNSLKVNELDQLFKRGHRGTNSIDIEGKGLGLNIVQDICKSYGWKVSVSVENSIFKLLIKLK